jgi:hypothetical protein
MFLTGRGFFGEAADLARPASVMEMIFAVAVEDRAGLDFAVSTDLSVAEQEVSLFSGTTQLFSRAAFFLAALRRPCFAFQEVPWPSAGAAGSLYSCQYSDR